MQSFSFSICISWEWNSNPSKLSGQPYLPVNSCLSGSGKCKQRCFSRSHSHTSLSALRLCGFEEVSFEQGFRVVCLKFVISQLHMHVQKLKLRSPLPEHCISDSIADMLFSNCGMTEPASEFSNKAGQAGA